MTVINMKYLIFIFIMLQACATSEQAWKKKQMLKQDKKMTKKVWRTRKFSKK